MKGHFQIKAINAKEVNHLFSLNDEELLLHQAVRMVVDEHPGYPCRISLADAEKGEEVLLFTYKHHNVTSPYYSEGPIFIRKNVKTVKLAINEIPQMLLHRMLSLRAYDKAAMMIDARTIEGNVLSETLNDIFENSKVDYIHIHNSGPGCYNCMVERVSQVC